MLLSDCDIEAQNNGSHTVVLFIKLNINKFFVEFFEFLIKLNCFMVIEFITLIYNISSRTSFRKYTYQLS